MLHGRTSVCVALSLAVQDALRTRFGRRRCVEMLCRDAPCRGDPSKIEVVQETQGEPARWTTPAVRTHNHRLPKTVPQPGHHRD